ncbi:subclass B3 metallo-beta-lactamase [Novosphingobium sp. Leaf2]|uniref:subclass B3 metallo-beta-lactamase n=1 Tax=Novosphingobium sp. Leaf2 TaxID=1735670 RepID=UPI0006F53B3A|nr:subclass B3 metallo-beta-lactamase [Novosphingobium sp. Leaf2]KQM18855.1 subclass B3 metallo-beta-lactamase [Novosphingobium sp. Leaf2]
MKPSLKAAALSFALALLPAAAHAARPAADQFTPAALAKACAGKDGWTDPAPPARVYGNTWYVGTCGITVILITSQNEGRGSHILIDGGPAAAAPLVLANIRRAGFNPRDVHWIVATHEHDDHAGALATIQRATGALLAALPAQKTALEAGHASAQDPQAAGLKPISPLKVTRTLADGGKVVAGTVIVTAHATPVHALGSTSWTWQSCVAPGQCRTIAYADSASTISEGDYRFSDHADRIRAIRGALPKIAKLPCDILITPHPSQSDLMERFAGDKPLVDPGACRAYADAARVRLEARLAKEEQKPR